LSFGNSAQIPHRRFIKLSTHIGSVIADKAEAQAVTVRKTNNEIHSVGVEE
jgi:hypothetical protein